MRLSSQQRSLVGVLVGQAKKAAMKTIEKKRQHMLHQRGGVIHGPKREPGAKKKAGLVCADHAGVDHRMNHLRMSRTEICLCAIQHGFWKPPHGANPHMDKRKSLGI